MALTQEAVYAACNDLESQGAKVTFREVYAKTGGSHSNVLAWWKAWKADYGEEGDDDLLPQGLVTALHRVLETDALSARHQALTQDLLPTQETRLAHLDAQYHEAEERLQTVQARLKAAVEELQVIRAEVVANRQALLAFVSGEDDGTTS